MMQKHYLVRFASCVLAVVVVDISASAQQPAPGSDIPTFSEPLRRSTRPGTEGPRELPASAATLTPLTLDVEVRHQPARGRASLQRQTVVRASDRVYMKVEGKEWLFIRNVVDPRRVSGVLAVHGARTLVHHDESDLRNMLNIRGWLDVLTFGFDPAELTRLTAVDRLSRLEDLAFLKHQARTKEDGIREVWWNGQQLLASRLVVNSGPTVTSIVVTRLRHGVDAALLRLLSDRYPEYKRVDLPEWLEGH